MRRLFRLGPPRKPTPCTLSFIPVMMWDWCFQHGLAIAGGKGEIGETRCCLGKKCECKSDNSTQCSQAVSHPSTDQAQCCLTSVIGRDLVFSTWYGRCRGRCEVTQSACALSLKSERKNYGQQHPELPHIFNQGIRDENPRSARSFPKTE